MANLFFTLWLIVAVWQSAAALVRRLRGAEWPGRGGPFLHVWLVPLLWPVLLASSGGVIGVMKLGVLVGGVLLGEWIGGFWQRPLDGAWIAMWSLLGLRALSLLVGLGLDWWCPIRPACACGSRQLDLQVRIDLPEAERADYGYTNGWPLICPRCRARYLHLAPQHRFMRLDDAGRPTPWLAVRTTLGRWVADPEPAPDLPPVPPPPSLAELALAAQAARRGDA